MDKTRPSPAQLKQIHDEAYLRGYAEATGGKSPPANASLNQHCSHCGDSVAWGSGKYVNRVPDGNDNPKGDFVCAECDAGENTCPAPAGWEVVNFLDYDERIVYHVRRIDQQHAAGAAQ